jgi:hypothetical protein
MGLTMEADGSWTRATRIVYVTNLRDAGPGSLRAALAELGSRTIVPRISGQIPDAGAEEEPAHEGG